MFRINVEELQIQSNMTVVGNDFQTHLEHESDLKFERWRFDKHISQPVWNLCKTWAQTSGCLQTSGGVLLAGSICPGVKVGLGLGVSGSVSMAMGASSIGWVSMLSTTLPLPPVEMF